MLFKVSFLFHHFSLNMDFCFSSFSSFNIQPPILCSWIISTWFYITDHKWLQEVEVQSLSKNY